MKTLVSFIGAGRRMEGETNTYQKTEYQFPDGSLFETAIFPEALISRKEMDIGNCVLIGTQGSSWGCLIEDAAMNDEQLFALYDALEQQFEKNAVQETELKELEKRLGILWKIPVQCHLHDSEIREDNALDVLFGYVNALHATDGSDFLIDITHGFRSMPVLLMASLQTLDAVMPMGVDLEVIYGEFKKGEPSPVRYLKPLWDGVRFARALRVFNERFDGELLSVFLKIDWPEGAKAITRLGNMIQANFFTKFDEALRQLNNAFSKFPESCNAPQLILVQRQLREFHKRLSSPATFHERLFALAEMLAERRLWGQAITTLQLSLEAFVFWKSENPDYGDYDATKELLKRFASELKRKDRDHFHGLRNTRNAIAHGGCRSSKGGLPQEGNLPNQFKIYQAFLKCVFCF